MQKTSAFTAKAFGEVVKLHRTRARITQEELADACNLHTVYVSMLENGRRHPTLDKVFLIAKALGMQPETLVKEVRERIRWKV